MLSVHGVRGDLAVKSLSQQGTGFPVFTAFAPPTEIGSKPPDVSVLSGCGGTCTRIQLFESHCEEIAIAAPNKSLRRASISTGLDQHAPLAYRWNWAAQRVTLLSSC